MSAPDATRSDAAEDVIEELRDPHWQGPCQHLRSWSDLDRLHEDAAAEIERLRPVVAAARAWREARKVGIGSMAQLVAIDGLERAVDAYEAALPDSTP